MPIGLRTDQWSVRWRMRRLMCYKRMYDQLLQRSWPLSCADISRNAVSGAHLCCVQLNCLGTAACGASVIGIGINNGDGDTCLQLICCWSSSAAVVDATAAAAAAAAHSDDDDDDSIDDFVDDDDDDDDSIFLHWLVSHLILGKFSKVQMLILYTFHRYFSCFVSCVGHIL